MGISDVITLLGGVALFLFGMSLMGDGLKKVAGNKLELVLYRLSSTPLSGVEVRRPRVVSSLPPATFFRESPMRDMPKRKKARPPSRVMMEARFIGVHPFRSRCSGLPPGWMSADTHY